MLIKLISCKKCGFMVSNNLAPWLSPDASKIARSGPRSLGAETLQLADREGLRRIGTTMQFGSDRPHARGAQAGSKASNRCGGKTRCGLMRLRGRTGGQSQAPGVRKLRGQELARRQESGAPWIPLRSIRAAGSLTPPPPPQAIARRRSPPGLRRSPPRFPLRAIPRCAG